ncbi:BREX-3 system phosphatase PglZ [Thalassovita taeanensis]|uniref:PglZ domain-containing protein n=1 Tax=Thalassovita taeanensis TaxID=657014 RepID=A0A1H9KE13_9RHOB|nr:BREX-3 system phosphatase PglZ [Thalassovita taeanensis]SEQ97352.1 PglZ domain-containing protein [Thalassovita taeanensis]
MSVWTDRILQEFPADLSRFWIALDPDGLLLDERILHGLRERGFEVLPFEDAVSFRTEYEERYRAAWDTGREGTAKALVLQLRGTDLNSLPWDYIRSARTLNLSLADLFPKLSYGVVRQIDSEHHEALFQACKKHAAQPLGEGATKDFILTHIFRLSPYLLNRPEDFWREVLRLHYRGTGLPELLAQHVATVLRDTPLGTLPIVELLSSKTDMVRAVQDAWCGFLAQHGVRTEGSAGVRESSERAAITVPFDHPDVRVIIDTMFLEGVLQPVEVDQLPAELPGWIKVGLIGDPRALSHLVSEGAKRIAADLPAIDASHRDWVEAARRLAELIYRFNELKAADADSLQVQIQALQNDADGRLREWVFQHFADLPSLPVAKSPVMVHHVPRYLAMRRSAGEDRIALLVFDGLALDQWVQIREDLSARTPEFSVDEGGCFAWLPTLTSISRQALFSGLKPREFQSSMDTTSQEPSLWTRFWQEHGLRKPEVIFQKGLKRSEQLAALEENLSKPTTKVAGIVVDMIDEIVHGAMLGKRGVAGQIREWCDTGFIEKLFLMLTQHGYHIYLTADHGNVDAEGIGRLSQGVVSELKGERVRAYRSEDLASSVPPEIDAFQFGSPGLPADFLPLYANERGAFVPKGNKIVAHGGMALEELIVPFVKIRMKKEEHATDSTSNRI